MTPTLKLWCWTATDEFCVIKKGYTLYVLLTKREVKMAGPWVKKML